MSDKSLVIVGDTTTMRAFFGEEYAGEDGTFDRYQLAGTYIRFLPGQEVPPMYANAGGDVGQFIQAWIDAYGTKGTPSDSI